MDEKDFDGILKEMGIDKGDIGGMRKMAEMMVTLAKFRLTSEEREELETLTTLSLQAVDELKAILLNNIHQASMATRLIVIDEIMNALQDMESAIINKLGKEKENE